VNVRLTTHDRPTRTELHTSIGRVYSDGRHLWLATFATATRAAQTTSLPLAVIAAIALDDDGAAT
jgi:hypothetical protein